MINSLFCRFYLAIMISFFTSSSLFAATQILNWDSPVEGGPVENYNIYYGTVDDVLGMTKISGITGTSYSINNLEDGIVYYFYVTAYNDFGEGPLSDVYSSLQGPGDPGDPGAVVTKIFGNVTGADFPGAIEDTHINIDQNNNVLSDTLNTYTWPENTVANGIIMKFDLSHIPPGAVLQSAILELYATTVGGDNSYQVSAHKIVNKNPNLSLSTGYTYDGINEWTANSNCYDNIPMAQADIDTAESIITLDLSRGYKNWSITEMVKDWLENPGTNYGLFLNSDATASADSFRSFASSEAVDAATRPRLTVIYSTGGVAPQILNISVK